MSQPICSDCSHTPHRAGECIRKGCLCREELASEELFKWKGPEGVKVEVNAMTEIDGELIECGVHVGIGDGAVKPSTARKLAQQIVKASAVAEDRLKRAKK